MAEPIVQKIRMAKAVVRSGVKDGSATVARK
jgi:hypothetical protein